MPSTYLSLHYHLVFGTKNREPLLAPAWRARLHDYLGGTIRGLGGYPEGVGGVADHVHLLVGLKATHCLADVLREWPLDHGLAELVAYLSLASEDDAAVIDDSHKQTLSWTDEYGTKREATLPLVVFGRSVRAKSA